MALSVSHYHSGDQTTPYPRPDRVTKTGVIAPYPIRQYSPVALARNTIRPFINDVRPGGPQLGAAPGAPGVSLPPMSANAQAGYRAAKRAHALVRGLPVAPDMTINRMVSATVVTSVPPGLRYEFDVARAQHNFNQATSRGTVWDIINARQQKVGWMRRGKRVGQVKR